MQKVCLVYFVYVDSPFQRGSNSKPEAVVSRDSVVDKDWRRWRSGTTANDDEDDDEDYGGFSQTGVETIKSSSGSSVGLLGLSIDPCQNTGSCDLWNPVIAEAHNSVAVVTQNMAALNGHSATSTSTRPRCDLQTLLCEIGLAKYASIFEEQDVDFDMFLTLTDDDLKEIGIKYVTLVFLTSAFKQFTVTN